MIFIGDKNHWHYQRYCGLLSAFTRKENTWNTWNLPMDLLGTYRSKLKKPWWRWLPMDRTVTRSPFNFLLMNVSLCNYSYNFFAFPSGFIGCKNSHSFPHTEEKVRPLRNSTAVVGLLFLKLYVRYLYDHSLWYQGKFCFQYGLLAVVKE